MSDERKMTNRIVGIDVARALAVFGMILVNFQIVLGDNGQAWLQQAVGLLEGKAAATFVVLVGVGIALSTNRAIQDQDSARLSNIRYGILKRAFFLFVIGLSYIPIWPADILHFYGVYMIVAILFLRQSKQVILFGAIAIILLFPFLMLFIDYESGWDFKAMTYSGFWTLKGFLHNLFINGFHPVIPWVAFMLFGLWFGRQDLRSQRFLKKTLFISSILVLLVHFFAKVCTIYITALGPEYAELTLFFETSPMPPLPLYLLVGTATAFAVIAGCILLGHHFGQSIVINLLKKTGQLALTFYVAHVIIGMGLLEMVSTIPLGEYTLSFTVIYSLFFSLACALFAHVWLLRFEVGPLEWTMKKLSSI